MALTVIDAGVVIGTLDAADAHHQASVDGLRARWDRGDRLVVPASVYAETLVSPFRHSTAAVEKVEAFYSDMGVQVEPVSAAIARSAARLRAEHGSGLRLPDALVLATAGELGADCVLTTDKRWPRGLVVPVDIV